MTAYNTDFYLWTQEQAEALRRRNLAALDLDNLAEEIDSLGRSEDHELASRLYVLLLHLLKYRYQVESRCGSWRGSIAEQRFRIERLLRDNPSLKQTVPETIQEEYPGAAERALYETGLDTLPPECPWTRDEVLGDFWPD